MPATFDELGSFIPTGTYEEIWTLAYPHNVLSSLIEWVENVPENTSLKVETNLSLDGVIWQGWIECVSGNPIPGVTPLTTDLANAKLRFRVTMSTTVLALPSLTSITLTFTAGYEDSQSWTSPIADLTGIQAGTSSIVWADTKPTGTDVEVYERVSYDGDTWTDWTEIQTTDAMSSEGFLKQYRITLLSDPTKQVTPSADNLAIEASDFSYTGVWVSPAIDMSFALDPATTKLRATYTTEAEGNIRLFTQTSEDGVVWTFPLEVELDGTVLLPNNHIKLYVFIIGDAVVSDIVLALDGEPSITVLKDGLSQVGEYTFTTLRNMLVIANGVDAPLKWDAVGDCENLGGTPPIMLFVVTHHNRVWGVEKAYTSRVRCSDPLDPETWNVLNFFDFNPEDGDYVTAMIRFGQNLVVSKQRSMALLTGDSIYNYGVTWLDSTYGATGARAICQAGNYLAYVSYGGVYVSNLVEDVNITDVIRPDWDGINHKRLRHAAITYWQDKLYVALPKGSSLHNNVVWCYDMLKNAWSILEGWEVSEWLRFKQYGTEYLFAASSHIGQVYRVLSTSYGGDETDIEYDVITKEFDFEEPERYKLFKTIFIEIEGIHVESALSVDLIVDGVVKGTYETVIEAGIGNKHIRRILPPVYGAVLGRMLTLRLRGKATLQGINILYVTKGTVATEEA